MTSLKIRVARGALLLIIGGLFIGDCRTTDLGAGSLTDRRIDTAPDIIRQLVEQSHSHVEPTEEFAYVSSPIAASGSFDSGRYSSVGLPPLLTL